VSCKACKSQTCGDGLWDGVGSRDGRALYACVLYVDQRYDTVCPVGRSPKPQLPVEIDSGGAKVKFKLERLLISHNLDSRVEHLTHPNQLVLCLTGREEWRRFSLSKTMSRACCDENDIVHTVLCSDLPVQLAIAAHMYRFMRVSHPVVTSLTLISPDLRVCCGLNSNRTSCSNSSSGAG
jgi:hypothetical protein